jgi:hypothetical protein
LPSKVSNSRFKVLKKDSAHALFQQFPFSSHALPDRGTVLLQGCGKGFGAVLDPSVGMEQQAFPSGAAIKGHPQGGKGRMNRLPIAAEGPADDFPVKQIQRYRQVYPAIG